MAIEQAALVLALALTKERELSEVEGRVRGEFLDDLLQAPTATWQPRSAAHGTSATRWRGHIVMLVCDIDDFRASNRQPARRGRDPGAEARVPATVSVAVGTSHGRRPVSPTSDQVVALLPLGGDRDAQGDAARIGARVQDAVADWKPGFSVSVGFSGVVEAPAGVAAALREVRGVLDIAGPIHSARPGRRRPRARPHRAPGGVTDGAWSLQRRHLGALDQHDVDHGTHLVATLRALSRNRGAAAGRPGCASTRTRSATGSTASARSAGVDLEDPETRLNLAVALRVQSLLGP